MKKTKPAARKNNLHAKEDSPKLSKKSVNLTLGFLVVILGLFSYLLILTRQVNDLRESPSAIGPVVVLAVDGLNKPLAVHAETGNLFIPEARLVLAPSPISVGDFVYRFTPAEGENIAEISIASSLLINQAKVAVIGANSAKDSLDAVPKLQACARGFKLYFQEKTDFSGTKVFEKTLKDGRKVYAYQEDGCSERRNEIVAYIKYIESY